MDAPLIDAGLRIARQGRSFFECGFRAASDDVRTARDELRTAGNDSPGLPIGAAEDRQAPPFSDSNRSNNQDRLVYFIPQGAAGAPRFS